MLYGATIIHYDPAKAKNVKHVIAGYDNTEIFAYDDIDGKLVITVEFEKDSDLQELEDNLLNVDGVVDVIHHAFNFEEEAEKLERGEITLDINEFAKMRDDDKERI